MRGNLDSYAQMRVMLTMGEVRTLESEGVVKGKITHSNPDRKWKEETLRIYLCRGDRVNKKELRRAPRSGYELYLSKKKVGLIREEKMVGADSPRRWFRDICISLEGVF